MKKIVLALMLAVPMLVNAQQKEFTAEHFEAVPSYVEFANGRCQIDVKLSIPPKFMRKTTVAELVPVFRWQDGLTSGDTLVLQGERGEGYGRIISYKNGFATDMPLTLVYQKGMENGRLSVDYVYKYHGKTVLTNSVEIPIKIDKAPYLIYETVKNANYVYFGDIKTGNERYDALITRVNNVESEVERIGLIDQLLVALPDNYMLHNNLGVIYQHKGDTDKAYKEMEKALALNPESKEVASNLCLLSIQENKMTSVRNLLSRAEGSPTYNEVLGNVMIIDGRYSYATGLLSENTTNSSLLAHILNQEYGKAGSLLNAKPDKDGMTYYLQSLLGLRSGNDALLESGLKTLRRVAPRLYMRARQSSDFSACMEMFKSIEQ